MKTLVTGAGGFIGGHLVERLISQGQEVIGLDLKPLSEWWQVNALAHNIDYFDAGNLHRLGRPDRPGPNLLAETGDVYHLADCVGGIGWIQSHRVTALNSIATMIGVLKALTPGQHRILFASSACVYRTDTQQEYVAASATPGLKERDAWPALPEEGYGLSKLYAEKLLEWYHIERGLAVRPVRFHNSYGPWGSWDDGLEKAPAALCRKVAFAHLTGGREIEIWGTGKETRSFMYVADNVTGTIELMHSGNAIPVNLGSSETVTIDELVDAIEAVAGRRKPLKRIYKPEAPIGVAARTSDNTWLKNLTGGWEPSTTLTEGVSALYPWVYDQAKRKYRL